MNQKYIDNLSKMIQKETISHVGQTDLTKFYEFHELLGQIFPSLWKAATVEAFEGNLLIKWEGKDHSRSRLFMSHHDVVDTNGTWIHDPFGAQIENGVMYGRGTMDTKGNLWAMLQAADDMAAEGLQPSMDVYFESACNEEISNEGAELISNILKDRGVFFELVVDEGPGVSDGAAKIGIGEKGCTELMFTAHEAGGHASRPGNGGGLVRLGRFMADFQDHMDEIFPKAMNKETGTDQQTTLAFTMIEGSKGRNVLPSCANVICSMRSSHHQTVEGSIAAATAFAKKYDLEVTILDHGFTSTIASPQGVPYLLLEAQIKKFFGIDRVIPVIQAGATDVRHMSKVCDGPLRFTPFRITEAQKLAVHSPEENVSISDLEPAVAFYKALMV